MEEKIFFDLEDFYKLAPFDMLRELKDLCVKNNFRYITYKTMKDLINKFQIGFRPRSLYAYLLARNDSEIEENYYYENSLDYKKDKMAVKESMWKLELRGTEEDIKIYENYIKEIYSYEEKKEYVDFKRRYLAK